ncbi:class I SAM-dependent methyltransferase [Halobacteriovorax sp. XZX-3]|uniref:class I SAM-dependent methyltransferase n=1 Tax=unclassified Halobacteriovorax TaxID=2639665 RepID=UPI0037218E4D
MTNLKYGANRFKEFPKKFKEDDFWKQVSWTVNGDDISEQDILYITESAIKHLSLDSNSHLLDLGCGNSALSSRFIGKLGTYLGVDYSKYLISIARKYFQYQNANFLVSNILDIFDKDINFTHFNKIFSYGVLSYLDDASVIKIFENISTKLINVDSIYIGNIPDISRAENFFYSKDDMDRMLHDTKSGIGAWRSVDFFSKSLSELGWMVEVILMPSDFFASHYRFDIIAKRDIP